MEIVKVQLGRAVWLFDTQELNPRGVALYPDLYVAFSKRYQFATLPKAEEIHAGGSLYFKQGRFNYELTSVAIDLELHNDGLVANCRHSTEAATAFLQDLVGWCAEQFGVTYPVTLSKKRIYRSELIVSMTPNLDTIADKIQQFARLLSAAASKPAQLAGLQFGSQDSPAMFVVERKANIPFEENHYIAAAWLQTAQHVDLLSRFEEILV